MAELNCDDDLDAEDHDLGDCEQWWGYTCEQCRQEYQERMTDWQLDNMLERKLEGKYK